MSSRISVALAVIECKPHGGQDQYVHELARHLVRRGHDVHVVASRAEGVDEVGATLHLVPLLRMPNLGRFAAFFAAASAFIHRHRARFDLVHATGGNVWAPDVATAHFCHPVELRSLRARASLRDPRTAYHASVQALGWGLDVAVYRGPSRPAIVAVSQVTESELVREYGIEPARIEVIHSGVNLDRFRIEVRQEHRAAARRELGLADGEVAILFVGAFERKGLDVVIRALARTPEPRPRLVVAGAGDPRRYRELADRLGVGRAIVWAGYQPRIERVYAACDALAFPTRYEPFGLVVAEAMACGLPAITTRVAGVSEILRDREDSVLLDRAEDDAELARAIAWLFDDRARTAAMGEDAARAMRSRSWSNVAAAYERVYERALRRGVRAHSEERHSA